jgi:hypothetical protein
MANLETQIPLGSLTFSWVGNPWENNFNNYLVLCGGVFHCFQNSRKWFIAVSGNKVKHAMVLLSDVYLFILAHPFECCGSF